MILFVGDKPSKRTNPNVPFKGAACEKRLMEWIKALKRDWVGYQIVNQAERDKFLDYVHMSCLRSEPIIALGSVASRRLRQENIPHFTMPHPSFRNRKLNDPQFEAKKLAECKEYIAKCNIMQLTT